MSGVSSCVWYSLKGHLEICIEQGSFEDIRYRHVKSRKDCTGDDINCWMSCDYLASKFSGAISEFKRVAEFGHRRDTV